MLGKSISHYKILEKLGEGGMGEVFLAQDTSLDRKVALKFLPDFMQEDPTARKRLLREAKSAASLDHPYICKIYEVGEAKGKDFISMEYVQGRTLKEKLADGPLALKDALEKATEIAEALEAAHKQDIVHRDLKPSNIMLTPEGHVKVMDFGLAKRLVPAEGVGSQAETLTASLTKTGTTVGTLAYMSPEQLRGEEVDTRSDVFSFGVVLYEMIGGIHPFRKPQQMETASAILRDEPSPLSNYVPDLPELLEHTLQKTLAKQAEHRYESGREVRVDLEQLVGAVPFIPPRPRLTRRQLLALTGLAVVTMLATFVGLDVGGWRDGLARVVGLSGPQRIQSLAVLPLENVSGDPDQDYFADGMTEALITDLGQIGALRVISRRSVMRYRGSDKPLLEIAQELNVDAVVEGSAQRVGQEAGITVRVIHAATEQQLWSQGYQRDFSNLLVLQSELARAIAQEIEIAMTPEEEARLAAERVFNPETYEAYLRGMHHLSNRSTPEALERGLAYLKQAIENDPADPLAYAGLALGYATLGHGPAPPRDAWPRARAAALRALRLDETLAEAHAALADVKLYYEWDWAGAEQAFQRANELNPSLAMNHYHYAWYLVLFGRLDEAVVEHKRAQELDPLTPLHTVWLGGLYLYARQYEEAIDEARESLERYPDNAIGLFVLGMANAQKGMYEEAIAAHEKMVAINPYWRYALGRTYAVAGRRDEARKILAELEEEEATPWGAFGLAILYTALGEKDEAFRWLAYEPPHAWLPWIRTDPSFEPLRDDPRFQDLLRRLGLPP